MRSEMAVLIAKDIHKSYPLDGMQLKILKGVDLEVEKGNIVALMGPSGSGKSTLLNILGTLDQPDSGSVLLNGHDVKDFTDEQLSVFRNRNIGFVFQFHHLLPELTLWENLELPLRLSENVEKSSIDYLQQLLVLTGLERRLNHYPSQLSGGERQRVAVIRALVNRPGIVLADEPTGNLDAENGARLMGLINMLCQEQGQTFLIATHSEVLAEMAHKRLYLHNGVINVTPVVAGV
jgi:lipoprotein-releasing system ATP-binding protein